MYDKLLKQASVFEVLAYKNYNQKKDYMREYMKERYHNTRNKIIQQLGNKCISCGSSENLHLDHKNKKKKRMNMADAHSVSDQKLKQELKNIQLLCKNCHKEKTHQAWDYGVSKPQHGSYWMYRKYKCRCNKCVQAYKESKKYWNK